MSSTMLRGALALGLAVLAGGCSMAKGKAESAIAEADSNLQAVAVDAQAYVPDQYAAAGAQLTAAKTDFESGSFADALTKAQEATTLVGGLAPAIEARKTELATMWQGMSEALPKTVQAIQGRVDELSKMRRLPAGITKEAVTQAQHDVQEMTASWTQAVEAQGKGDLATATSLAAGLQAKADQVMNALGMAPKQ
jgi:hypothetical protein